MRPFWIHQLAEYLIGVALVAQGLQDPEPLVPALAGALVMVNVSLVRGPLGAFKFIGRRTHRWLDLLVMTTILVGAAQPWLPVAASGRLIMLVMLLPLGFLWFYTDWAERPDRKQRRAERATPTSEDWGRAAGRLAGNTFASGKRAVKKRSEG